MQHWLHRGPFLSGGKAVSGRKTYFVKYEWDSVERKPDCAIFIVVFRQIVKKFVQNNLLKSEISSIIEEDMILRLKD